MIGGPGSASPLLVDAEFAPGFEALGMVAFTTARAAGTFGLNDPAGDPVALMERWDALRQLAAEHGAPRLVSAHQVHGDTIVSHGAEWAPGWLRVPDADGHLVRRGAVAMAVTIADCVPVFLAHPNGAAALLHAGWRGTASRILPRAIDRLTDLGCDPGTLRLHLGPSISGEAYEVGPEVHLAVRGDADARRGPLDLRAVLAEQARAAGAPQVTISPWCTVGAHPRWFSHRRGDMGRQVAVLIVPSA